MIKEKMIKEKMIKEKMIKEKMIKEKENKISFLLHNAGYHTEQFILVYFMCHICIFSNHTYQKIH